MPHCKQVCMCNLKEAECGESEAFTDDEVAEPRVDDEGGRDGPVGPHEGGSIPTHGGEVPESATDRKLCARSCVELDR